MSPRETVELVDGSVYVSDDHWVTVYRIPLGGRGGLTPVIGKRADQIRAVAIMQHGGGRDEPTKGTKQ